MATEGFLEVKDVWETSARPNEHLGLGMGQSNRAEAYLASMRSQIHAYHHQGRSASVPGVSDVSVSE